jgi:hypothetical protein
MSAAMSETPDPSEQPSPANPPDSPLSESSKRKIARMATTVAVIVAGVAVLVTGIAIGNATRKRVDKWAHAS